MMEISKKVFKIFKKLELIAAGIYFSHISREKSFDLALPTMLGWLRQCYTQKMPTKNSNHKK